MPTGDQTAFGDLLRRQRVAEGLTQEQLAERAGLSVRGVSDLERGIRRAPHRATVLRLADGLGLAETERALLSASARRSASVQAPVTDHASVVLPSVLTSFVGRQRELEAIGQLLISSRLLTLIGAGGIGKTRLALRAAADAAQLFSDGTHAVELAPLSDPDLLVHAVASALRIPEQRARPLSVTLIDRLRLKRLLLVLDNCEHLVESIARLADHLLRACSDVHILATSRESLGVAGEVVWRVPPLAMPDPAGDVTLQELVQTDAVRLFVERAQAVLPGFAETLNDRGIREVAKVCQQLDGIPLAIELAAARARVLAPEEIAERLQDRFSLLVGGSRTVPARHQTLRATVDWSYGLLSEAHRRLFDRLSVFAGSWTLRAAEAVCSGSGTEIRQVLDLITQLVDKSLVLTEPGTSGEMRYRMLETLREYAMEKLRERGETPEWRARHAAWFLALAEQAAPELRGPDQLRWLERLRLEYDNLRAALHWCLDGDGTIETGVKLAGALAGFWRIRGHVSEGQAWLERARARADEAPPSAHATLLNGSGELAQFQDRFGLARGLHEESLAIRRALGDRHGTAQSLRNLGLALLGEGALDGAKMCFDESLTIARNANDRWAMAASLTGLGNLAHARGELDDALSCFQESLALARERNDAWQIAYVLHCLGHLACAREDAQSAAVWLSEGLNLSVEVGDERGIAVCLESLALVAVGQGQPELATRLLGAASAIRIAVGVARRRHIQIDYERTLAAARTALGHDRFAAIWADGQALTPDQAIAEVFGGQGSARAPSEARPGQPTDKYPLTRREREVAVLIARGCSNHQIASELIIAEGTAQRHVANILAKLGYDSRTQVAVWAVDHGLTAAPA